MHNNRRLNFHMDMNRVEVLSLLVDRDGKHHRQRYTIESERRAHHTGGAGRGRKVSQPDSFSWKNSNCLIVKGNRFFLMLSVERLCRYWLPSFYLYCLFLELSITKCPSFGEMSLTIYYSRRSFCDVENTEGQITMFVPSSTTYWSVSTYIEYECYYHPLFYKFLFSYSHGCKNITWFEKRDTL